MRNASRALAALARYCKKPIVPTVAFLWTQFAPYHVDRCEAAVEALAGRYDVLACELATASATYAWEPSGAVRGARKLTLYPGSVSDSIPWHRKLVRLSAALRCCSVVFIGISYAEPTIFMLAVLLRLFGVRLVLMTESKFDDRERAAGVEFLKALSLAPYSAAFVGGFRQRAYVRFLGFRRRPIELGYDSVSLKRVRDLAAAAPDRRETPFAERSFIFVGRFVAKKNIPTLIKAYAHYHREAQDVPRRLTLLGGGEMEGEVRAAITTHGLEGWIDLPGFRQAPEVAAMLERSLALLLPSIEEQWGLVVNEALAFALPVIVSDNVGSRDLLVRNGTNGFVVPADDHLALAHVMADVASSEARWRQLSAGSAALADAADTPRFGSGAAALVDKLLNR